MDAKSLLGHIAFGIDVDVKNTTRGDEIGNFDRADFHDAMTLRRIETGEYGYCEMTGEPISLKRLDARPIATMTLEAQERHERRERVHRDD